MAWANYSHVADQSTKGASNSDGRVNKLAKNGKLVIALTIVAVLYAIFYFGLAFRGLDTATLLDNHFLFSPDSMHQTLSTYGQAGRAHYMRVEFLDMLAIIISLAQAAIIYFGFQTKHWAVKAAGVPLLAAALNMVKDVLFIGILLLFPHEPSALVWTASLVNGLKILAVGASFGLLVSALLAIAIRQISQKNG